MLRKYEASLVWSISLQGLFHTTASAPLRQLTKSGEPFVWGPDQQQSFDELKKRLSSAETLGYFDTNAPTKVIANQAL